MLTSTAFQKLGEAETSGTEAKEQNIKTNFGSYSVHAVDGTGGCFEERGIFLGEAMEFEECFYWEDAVFCKASVHYSLVTA
jgi:hypothetical protein